VEINKTLSINMGGNNEDVVCSSEKENKMGEGVEETLKV
jgi:hypothetical protein